MLRLIRLWMVRLEIVDFNLLTYMMNMDVNIGVMHNNIFLGGVFSSTFSVRELAKSASRLSCSYFIGLASRLQKVKDGKSSRTRVTMLSLLEKE